ncbi:MAG TPA: DHA2 family efflux MFS transporter permease subunit [Nocardioides sp.]|jgi:EmrB/QacA subfamily drug resistance transporter|uniref:MFS transporter n=1 Tax=Nocardioides sp. TaxID=35761 RepID=UPI002E353107|nr:DHA2 family efflux MFS transporter permease subunit [Nocardioides sp.]HEX3930183.1 DHA2 family efflux MFS transporter permease subunit [Nocardioides sp.]
MSQQHPPATSGADPKWWTLTAVCLGVFMLLLDITIVNVALPDIQDQLHASLSDLQWVIDAYALSLAALLLTAGSLADLYGRRLVFVIGLVVFTFGSVACGSAQNITFLTISRAFQGIGGAAMFATALALLAAAFHGKDRGTAFGVFGATTGVAVAIGPVLGGALTSGLSWRWIFFVNVPICLVALAVTLMRLVESKDRHAGRPDWFGFVSFSIALGALVYGLIEAGEDGWGEQRVVLSFVLSGVLLVVFVVSQLLQEHPMFDLGLLRKPTFTGGLIAAFGVSASIFSLLTYLVIYVQNVLGYSAVATGVRFLFLSVASFFAAAVAGRLTEKMPVKWLIGPGFLILGVGLLLIHGIHEDSSWTHLIPGLLVSGFGVGMINPPLASTAVGVVPVSRAGMASGVNSTFRQVGIATGIAALGSIFSQRVADAVRPQLVAGHVPANAVHGLTAALSGGQVVPAATGAQQAASAQGGAAAGQQAYDLVRSVGTSGVVDSLNHITMIAAVMAFVVGALCLVLIRQKDFVDRSATGQPTDDSGRVPETAV